MLRLHKVKGKSMSPYFNEGDYVLSFFKKPHKLKEGDIIIFKDSVYGRMIKKISKKQDEGLTVSGTHPYSTDSKTLGLIPFSNVIGKVIWKIPNQI